MYSPEGRRAEAEYTLPLAHVNLRAQILNKLDKHEAVWSYRSHDFDSAVLEYLQQHWPLDYGSS